MTIYRPGDDVPQSTFAQQQNVNNSDALMISIANDTLQPADEWKSFKSLPSNGVSYLLYGKVTGAVCQSSL